MQIIILNPINIFMHRFLNFAASSNADNCTMLIIVQGYKNFNTDVISEKLAGIINSKISSQLESVKKIS